MVRNNIIESIQIIDNRLNKKQRFSFDGQRLINLIQTKTSDLV